MKVNFQLALPLLLVLSMAHESVAKRFCNHTIGVSMDEGDIQQNLCNGVANGPLKLAWRIGFCGIDSHFGVKLVSGPDEKYSTSSFCQGSVTAYGNTNVPDLNLGDWRIPFDCKSDACAFIFQSVLVDCGCPPGQMVVTDCFVFREDEKSTESADAVCAPMPTESPTARPTTSPTPRPTVRPTSSPTKAQTSDPCFSEMTSVRVKNVDAAVLMKDIRIGDLVLTRSGSYHPVYAWGHLDTNRSTEFLQIHTADKSTPLEITREHMLFVQGRDGPVRADKIEVGHVLLGVIGKQNQKVVKVSKVKRSGLYAPLTLDGTIVVNDGLIASNYMDPHDDNGDEYMKLHEITLPLIKADMSHIWFSPLRMMCMGVSSKMCEYQNANGLHAWAEWGLALVNFAEEHKSFVVQLMIYSLMIIVPSISMIVEAVAGPSLGPLVVFFAGIVAYKMWKGRKVIPSVSIAKKAA